MTKRSVRAPFEFRGLTLDEFQIRAIIALQQETATLVSAPTGTGKSLIADYLVDDSLKSGRRVVYTAPIKALVSQKYRDFRAAFGASRTGIMTGDLSENAGAPLVVMTTEVLRNMLLHGGLGAGMRPGPRPTAAVLTPPDWIVFDEIHYINHPERGTVWEEAILLLPKGVRILGLSATVPNIRELASWLERALGEPVATVVHEERAVPLRLFYFTDDGHARTRTEAWEHLTGGDLKGDTLSFDREEVGARKRFGERDTPEIGYGDAGGGRSAGRGGGSAGRGAVARGRETSRGGGRPSRKGRRRSRDAGPPDRHLDVIRYVSREGLFPCIYFAFSRRECERMAKDLARRRNFLRPHERNAVHVTVRQILRETGLRPGDVPGLTAMRDMWHRGIGVHHAGLVPIVKHIVEHLLERRILRVVFATETFAVGVNMPVRTVCFDDVAKFDGRHRRLLTQQEFLQMAGRAGRRGLDKAGTVLVRADADAMEEADWRDWESASLEPITSRLSLSYTTVLNLVERFFGAEAAAAPQSGQAARPSSPAAPASSAAQDSSVARVLPADRASSREQDSSAARDSSTAPPSSTARDLSTAPPLSAAQDSSARLGTASSWKPSAVSTDEIPGTVREWLSRSLFVVQSEQPGEALEHLTAQFAEKVRELRRLGYLTVQSPRTVHGSQAKGGTPTSPPGASTSPFEKASVPLHEAPGGTTKSRHEPPAGATGVSPHQSASSRQSVSSPQAASPPQAVSSPQAAGRESAARPTTRLTPKGMLCRGIWVKELLVTEVVFDGTLAEMNPVDMAGWAAAVVWESRPQDAQLPPAAPSWLVAVHLATDRIARWTGPGVRDKLRVEGRIAPVVSRWAAAADDIEGLVGHTNSAPGGSAPKRLDDTAPHTSADDLAKFLRGFHLEPGDFVSLCRQTVDLLRQIASSADHVLRMSETTGTDETEASGTDEIEASGTDEIEASSTNEKENAADHASMRSGPSTPRETVRSEVLLSTSIGDTLRKVRDTARAAIAAIDRGVVAASRTG